MKTSITTLALIGAFSTSATTLDKAQELFSKRGEDLENVKKAEVIYENLAKEAKGIEKALLLLGQSEALYYLGIKSSLKKDKKTLHEEGYTVANTAREILEKEKASNTEVAKGYYWFSANIGKWGQAKGLFSSLREWDRSMKPALFKMKELDDTIQSYGVYRVLGIGYIKIPKESKTEGLDYLAKAYRNTVKTHVIADEEVELSYHVNNVTFFLEGMIKEKKDSWAEFDFCEIYDNAQFFHEEAQEDEKLYESYNKELIPETKSVYADFFSDKKFTKYYEKTCN